MICLYCKRELPNKNWITKYGCKWCDIKYYRINEKQSIRKLGQKIIRTVFTYQGHKNWAIKVAEKLWKNTQ